MPEEKKKTCPICGSKFLPWMTTQRVCSNYKCALTWNKQREAEALAKMEHKRINPRKKKGAPKTWAEHNSEAQAAFNRYIRVRDAGRNCHACGTQLNDNDPYKPGEFVDASHYKSRGSNSHLRFNVLNCVTCCWHCNRQMSGNTANLRTGMIDRFGSEIVGRIENDYTIRRFDIRYLIRLKAIFTRRADHLIKLRSGEYKS